MKVVSYHSVVPPKNKSQEKYEILSYFLEGVEHAGDQAVMHQGYDLVDADVAVIQGWQHEHGKNLPHLRLRENIIRTQLQSNKFVICADANLLLYATPNNKPFHYLRYSINGVFPNTGNYCDDVPNPRRWQQIQQDTGIQIEPLVNKGKNIVICLQRDGGWSMGKDDLVKWCKQTINSIREHSDRTIVIRPHPKDKKAINTYLPVLKNMYKGNASIKFSNFNTPLDADLNKAWCVVNKNSSSIVGPIIKGYHAFITDPETSQCAEVAHADFSKIENPEEFNRQAWLERISMFHWKFSELRDGTCWRHMKNYCQ